jgi:hypothetical protein
MFYIKFYLFSIQSLCSVTRVQSSFVNLSAKIALQIAESYKRLGTIVAVRRILSWPNIRSL